MTPFIRVGGEELCFSAAHFITFDEQTCEPIHGHDYCLSVRLAGPLNAERYVVDFVVVKELLKRLVAPLDHRTLLPIEHPRLRVEASEREVEVSFHDRRWILPRTDCVLLPIANTTAEELAAYLGRGIRGGLATLGCGATHGEVELQEGPGYSAGWTWNA